MFRHWWNELWKPALKCERLGHSIKTKAVIFMKKAELCIGAEYKGEQKYCSRCSYKEVPSEDEYLGQYASIEWPNSMWEDFNRDGYIVY